MRLCVGLIGTLYAKTSREDFGVGFGEEGVMEFANYFGGIVFFDYEGQVNFGGALGDHADFFVFEKAENFGGYARSFAEVFSYQADYGFAAFVFYVG